MLASRPKLDCLVFGYLRNELLEDEGTGNDLRFEQNLSMVIADYLLLKEYFEHYNINEIKASDDELTIQKVSNDALKTCYGSIRIPSTNKSVHHWKLKVVESIHNLGDIAIGIDETKYLRLDTGLYGGGTQCYALWSDGYISISKIAMAERTKMTYGVGDTIEMILDLNQKIISVCINEQDIVTIFGDIEVNEELEYCMAVTVFYKQQSIQLMDYYEE